MMQQEKVAVHWSKGLCIVSTFLCAIVAMELLRNSTSLMFRKFYFRWSDR